MDQTTARTLGRYGIAALLIGWAFRLHLTRQEQAFQSVAMAADLAKARLEAEQAKVMDRISRRIAEHPAAAPDPAAAYRR